MTNQDNKLFYKFRSINALLDVNNELEDEYIYLSPAKDLNDPLEGYTDIMFYGDRILWTNFFKNYLFSLFMFFSLVYLAGDTQEFSESKIHPAFDSHLKEIDSLKGKPYKIACDEILSNKCILSLINHLSTRENGVSKDELYAYLLSLHLYFLNIFRKVHIENNLMEGNYKKIIEKLDKLHKDQQNLLKLIDFLNKNNNDAFKIVKKMLQFTNEMIEIHSSIQKLNDTNESIAKKNHYLLMEFPKIYLNNLHEVMFSSPYISCFSEKCDDLSMWGYYTDSSKGACLIFKPVKKGNSYFLPLSDFCTENYIDYQLLPVTYAKKKPLTNFFRSIGKLPWDTLKNHWFTLDSQISDKVKDLFNGDQQERWREDYWEHIKNNTNTKHENWKHECEYRISINPMFDDSFDTIEKRKLKYKFENLEGLILGVNIKQEDKLNLIKVLLEKCKKYNRTDFKLYQAIYDNDEGSLNLIPINITRYMKILK